MTRQASGFFWSGNGGRILKQKIMKNNTRGFIGSFVALVSAAVFLTGCQSSNNACCAKPGTAATPAPAPTVAAVAPAVPAPAAPAALSFPLRIKAGVTAPIKDADGNTWQPEQGFEGGDTIDRGDDMQIENTKSPALYRTEHYSMTGFSCPLPNGKYTVKLHFCETYEGIEGPGQRVFSFSVQGHEFKDFDVWVKAGGPRKPYIETVNVDVTNGKLEITFTSNVENPEINAIEISPAS